MKNNCKICLVGLVPNHQSLYNNIIDSFLLREYTNFLFITRIEVYENMSANILDKVKVICDTGSDFKILKKNLNLINKSEVIFVDEVFDRFYRSFSIKLKSKIKFLIIHNPNRWLINFFKFNLRFLDAFLFKKFFFNQFDSYVTISPSVKKYFDSISNVNKNSFFFPFDISKKKLLKRKNNTKITISVPGSINELRRNYVDFLKSVWLYFQNNPNSSIQFKLLGKLDLNSSNVVELINRINSINKRVYFWKDYIGVDEFEYELNNSDYLLSNVKLISDVNNRIEIYGLTKETGITYLSYKWAKPLIVQQNQIIFSELNSQLIRFDDWDNFGEVLNSLNKNNLNILNKNAIHNTDLFNAKIKIEIEKIFDFININTH